MTIILFLTIIKQYLAIKAYKDGLNNEKY